MGHVNLIVGAGTVNSIPLEGMQKELVLLLVDMDALEKSMFKGLHKSTREKSPVYRKLQVLTVNDVLKAVQLIHARGPQARSLEAVLAQVVSF